MGYGICRCSKVAGASGGSGAYIHNEREKEHSNTNPDIDFERSKQNYSFGTYENISYNQRAENRIAEGYQGKRAVRKDAVKMVEFLFAPSDAEALPEEQHKEFLKSSYEWLCERYGKENVIADTVHMDEKTPHLHAVVVPLTKDGRLSAKQVIGGPKQLQELQDSFYENVSKKFGLERGERADLGDQEREIKKHVPQMEFKKRTLAELETRIEEKENELHRADIKLSFKQKKAENIENRVFQLAEQRDAAMIEILNLEKQKEQLESDVTSLATQKTALESNIEGLKTHKKQWDEIVEEKQTEAFGLNYELQEAKKQLQELRGQFQQQKTSYERNVAVIREQKRSIETNEATIQEQKSTISKLEVQVKTLLEPFKRILSEFFKTLGFADRVMEKDNVEMAVGMVELARDEAMNDINKPLERGGLPEGEVKDLARSTVKETSEQKIEQFRRPGRRR